MDSAGICLVCGFRADVAAAREASAAAGSRVEGAIPIDYSVSAEESTEKKAELPEWRKELTKRLYEIKQKRNNDENSLPQSAIEADLRLGEGNAMENVRLRSEMPPPDPNPIHDFRHNTEDRSEQELPAMPLHVSNSDKPTNSEAKGDPEQVQNTYESADIKNLIDNLIARQANAKEEDEIGSMESEKSQALPKPREDKLILLSRTLAGLLDLAIVILIGCSFILAVDIIEGIELYDTVSFINSLVLLIATFFVYSIFFLGTTNQTIGMMITDLRVVGTIKKRPKMTQLLTRCVTYLAALFGLGIGLLMGCFDRRNRCLHDRLSGTTVVRVLPY